MQHSPANSILAHRVSADIRGYNFGTSRRVPTLAQLDAVWLSDIACKRGVSMVEHLSCECLAPVRSR